MKKTPTLRADFTATATANATTCSCNIRRRFNLLVWLPCILFTMALTTQFAHGDDALDGCPSDQESILQIETYLAEAAVAKADNNIEEAIRLLELASDICEAPLIMYNLGVLNDINGDSTISISYYMNYLDSNPIDGDLVKKRLLQINPNIVFREPKPEPVEEAVPESLALSTIPPSSESATDTAQGEQAASESEEVTSGSPEGTDSTDNTAITDADTRDSTLGSASDNELADLNPVTAEQIQQDQEQNQETAALLLSPPVAPLPSSVPASKSFRPSLKSWIAMGVGVVGLAASGYFTWKTIEDANNGILSEAQDSAMLANISFGTAGAGLVTSGIIMGLDYFKAKRQAAAEPSSHQVGDHLADTTEAGTSTPAGPSAATQVESDRPAVAEGEDLGEGGGNHTSENENPVGGDSPEHREADPQSGVSSEEETAEPPDETSLNDSSATDSAVPQMVDSATEEAVDQNQAGEGDPAGAGEGMAQ